MNLNKNTRPFKRNVEIINVFKNVQKYTFKTRNEQ
jgi:hypothetical protein